MPIDVMHHEKCWACTPPLKPREDLYTPKTYDHWSRVYDRRMHLFANAAWNVRYHHPNVRSTYDRAYLACDAKADDMYMFSQEVE